MLQAPLGVPGVLLVFCAGLGFAFCQAVYAVLGAWRPFLGIHLLHSYLFVAAPACGALVAWGRPRRPTRAARVTAAGGALLLAGVGVYSSWIEPFTLTVESATVPLLPERAGRDELLIGVLADIQCAKVTDREREAAARVMAARPDLILLPGDLSQAAADEWAALVPAMRELLSTLHAPLGVYFVLGNTDSVPEIAYVLLKGTGVRLLHNEVVELIHGDRRVTLGGVELNPGGEASAAVLQRLAAPGGDDLRLLVAHRPDWVLELPPTGRVDLVVAGHTHGGQVQLPFLGPPLTLSGVPRRAAGGGLHEVAGHWLYVSRGLGHEHGDAPRVRFLSPPEVTLLTLRTVEAPGEDGAR
jgi:hypothetical protein